MRPVVIIPTYNERDNIKRLIPTVLGITPDVRILVVDDDSPDGTGGIVDGLIEQYPRLGVIHRKGEKGYGPAVRDGMGYVLENYDADIILTMDADFSHNPDELVSLLDAFKDNSIDVVVGSRYINGVRVVNWDLRRLILSAFANRFVSAVTGIRVSDCTSGFMGYRANALRNIPLDKIDTDGYGFLFEMKYMAKKKGFSIREVPITFYGRSGGKSKFSFRIILEAFLLVWKLRFL